MGMKRFGAGRTRRSRSRGQALVEFSIALIPFLLILMGIADLGRGIYMSNGVSQAAREIARVTAVHPCAVSCTLGNSTQTASVVATQKRLIPGLSGSTASITYACTTVNDTVVSGTGCAGGNYIRVTVSVPYAAATPLLSMVAPTTLVSTAHVQVP
jgi:Flp pilus assembly protein TadG